MDEDDGDYGGDVVHDVDAGDYGDDGDDDGDDGGDGDQPVQLPSRPRSSC